MSQLCETPHDVGLLQEVAPDFSELGLVHDVCNSRGYVLHHLLNSLVAVLVHVRVCSGVKCWSGQDSSCGFSCFQHAVGIVIGSVGYISTYFADADKSWQVFQESVDECIQIYRFMMTFMKISLFVVGGDMNICLPQDMDTSTGPLCLDKEFVRSSSSNKFTQMHSRLQLVLGMFHKLSLCCPQTYGVMTDKGIVREYSDHLELIRSCCARFVWGTAAPYKAGDVSQLDYIACSRNISLDYGWIFNRKQTWRSDHFPVVIPVKAHGETSAKCQDP